MLIDFWLIVYLDFPHYLDLRACSTVSALFGVVRLLIILGHLFGKGGAPIFSGICKCVYLGLWLDKAILFKFEDDLRVISEVVMSLKFLLLGDGLCLFRVIKI